MDIDLKDVHERDWMSRGAASERIEEMPSTLHIPPAWFIATAIFSP
jgi:hypothetical protein